MKDERLQLKKKTPNPNKTLLPQPCVLYHRCLRCLTKQPSAYERQGLTKRFLSLVKLTFNDQKHFSLPFFFCVCVRVHGCFYVFLLCNCGISGIKALAVLGSSSPWVHGCRGRGETRWFPSASISVPGSFEGFPGQKPGHGWQSSCCLAAVTHVRGQSGSAMPASLRAAVPGVKEPPGKHLPGCLLLHLPHRVGGGEHLGTLCGVKVSLCKIKH